MNKRNALLDTSRVISCALSSLEFIRKTICYADPTFDEQVKRLFLALPSLDEESAERDHLLHLVKYSSFSIYIFLYFCSWVMAAACLSKVSHIFRVV